MEDAGVRYRWRSTREQRMALVEFIRENAEEINHWLNRSYIADHPHSRVSTMPYDLVSEWTTRYLGDVENCLLNDRMGELDYRRIVGDIVHIPGAPDFAGLGASVATCVWQSSVMSRYISKKAPPFLVSQLLDALEDFYQCIMVSNLKAYTERISTPGALREKWDYLGSYGEDEEEASGTARGESGSGASAAATSSVHSVGVVLTAREEEVLSMLLEGFSNKRICAELGLKLSTVKNYVSGIFGKYQVSSRSELLSKVLKDF